MRVGLLLTLVMILLISGCAGTDSGQSAPILPQSAATQDSLSLRPDIQQEVMRLREALLRDVPQHGTVMTGGDPGWIGRAQATIAATDFRIDRPQLLVVIDRNPAVQEMRILLALPYGEWQVIGGTKVSTGQAGRRGYFITPVGVFLHTTAILDYRALGTFNENHIRGLGVKGMRVWDFGWQTAERGWRADRDEADIRLQMHATDPDYLEPRLGRPASQGCVRIPATMNRFLDRHGVLDADYERNAPNDPRLASVLLADREPTPLAGDAMIVVDSAQAVQ